MRKRSARSSSVARVRVRGLRHYDEQRRYLVEQLSSALGADWLERNEGLVDAYWYAVVALGYALPDERHADGQEAA